jgi:hypothetical protein
MFSTKKYLLNLIQQRTAGECNGCKDNKIFWDTKILVNRLKNIKTKLGIFLAKNSQSTYHGLPFQCQATVIMTGFCFPGFRRNPVFLIPVLAFCNLLQSHFC